VGGPLRTSATHSAAPQTRACLYRACSVRTASAVMYQPARSSPPTQCAVVQPTSVTWVSTALDLIPSVPQTSSGRTLQRALSTRSSPTVT